MGSEFSYDGEDEIVERTANCLRRTIVHANRANGAGMAPEFQPNDTDTASCRHSLDIAAAIACPKLESAWSRSCTSSGACLSEADEGSETGSSSASDGSWGFVESQHMSSVAYPHLIAPKAAPNSNSNDNDTSAAGVPGNTPDRPLPMAVRDGSGCAGDHYPFNRAVVEAIDRLEEQACQNTDMYLADGRLNPILAPFFDTGNGEEEKDQDPESFWTWSVQMQRWYHDDKENDVVLLFPKSFA